MKSGCRGGHKTGQYIHGWHGQEINHSYDEELSHCQWYIIQTLRQYLRYSYRANKAAAVICLKEVFGLNLGAKHDPFYVIKIPLAILSLCLLVKYVTVTDGSTYKQEQRTILKKGMPGSAF